MKHPRPVTAAAVAAVAAIGGALCPAVAVAQAYPAKTVRLVLPFPPGGPTDLLGRSVAQKLSEQMGQQVIADNRPGAGGNLGLELVAKGPADGYSMVLSSPLVSISPSLYARLNYDPAKDLAPVSLVAVIQNLLIVHPSVPAKTLKEFVALAKGSPGKLNYGSGGVGTTSHLAPELFKSLTKINMVHVPYKGTGQAMLGMIGGQIDALVIAAPIAAPHAESGKVRPVALFAAERMKVLPNVPTAKEAGVDGLDVPIWYGILMQSNTPKDMIGRMNAELVKALASPDLRDRLAGLGVEATTNTPDQFAAFIRNETVRFSKVIKDAGIKGE